MAGSTQLVLQPGATLCKALPAARRMPATAAGPLTFFLGLGQTQWKVCGPDATYGWVSDERAVDVEGS